MLKNFKANVAQGSHPFVLGQWWIDDRGIFHPAIGIDRSLNNLFLRHLGQIKLNVTPNRTDIMWDTRNVETAPLASVLNRLSMCRQNITIKLHFFYFGWVSEIYDHCQDALERILLVQNNRSIAMLHPTQINDHTIQDIEIASTSIRHGYDLWKRSAGHYKNIPEDKLAAYLPYTSIYHHNRRDDSLIFSWIGDESTSSKVYGSRWSNEMIGEDTGNPSGPETPEYASKISKDMKDTLQTGEPRFQHIRTLVEHDGAEPIWVSYERLISPYQMANDGTGIDVICHLTQHISIPFAGAP